MFIYKQIWLMKLFYIYIHIASIDITMIHAISLFVLNLILLFTYDAIMHEQDISLLPRTHALNALIKSLFDNAISIANEC